MMVATPQTSDDPAARPITTIAICAGSGGGVFGKLKQSVDLLLTGELVHHEVLAVIEQGGSAICLNHSNSERAYLGAVMKGLLQAEIEKVWKDAREGNKDESARGWDEEGISVDVSRTDRDPFGYVVRSV
jgi:putative NIF3 family GTP cyclohydrolase 1 type 2